MEEEFEDIDRRNAWHSVFQEVRNKSSSYNYTFKDAKRIENKTLNRYRDVNPYDHSRIRLQRGEKDYINASLVEVASANRSYILTQGPLPVTTGHFWLMIWEQKSKAILMLNRIIEKNAVKCHQYWPTGSKNNGEDEMVLNDVGLRVNFISEKEAPYHTVRELLLTDLQSGQSRIVLQFHYTTWPDFGVPESPSAFLNFLFAVRESGVLSPNVGPAVVHCSAGIGRSGTFCLVDSCLVLIQNKDKNSINIREHLLEMRRYRMGLIQTPDQLRFSYMAIIEGAKKIIGDKQTSNNVPLNQQDELLEEPTKKKFKSSESLKVLIIPDEIHLGLSVNEESDNESSPPPLPPRFCHKLEDSSPTRSHFLPRFNPAGEEPAISEGVLNISEEIETKAHVNHIPFIDDSVKQNHDVGNFFNQNSVSNEKVHPAIAAEDCIAGDSLTNSEALITTQHEVAEGAEIRKRKRKERLEKTAALVQNIKKKQKEIETRDKRRSLVKRVSLGLVIFLGTGVLLYRLYMKA